MIKKLLLGFALSLLVALPLKTLAVGEKLEAPSFIAVKVDNKEVAKDKVKIAPDQVLTLEGGAQPDSKVFLYIYSDKPLLAEASADKDGHWSYTLNQALAVGNHRIEGEVHQGDQISAKVELLRFEVSQPILEKVLPSKSSAIYWILILVLLLLIVLYWQRKNIFKKGSK